MTRLSDSAVSAFLRARLDHHALPSTARHGGWHTADIRSPRAEQLFPVLPEQAPPHGTPIPVRRALGHPCGPRSCASWRQEAGAAPPTCRPPPDSDRPASSTPPQEPERLRPLATIPALSLLTAASDTAGQLHD